MESTTSSSRGRNGGESINVTRTQFSGQEERLASIIDNAIDGIVTLNEHFEIESWNPAAEKMFCYTAEEIIGQSVRKIIMTPTHLESDKYIAKHLQAGQARIVGLQREQISGRRKDGTVFAIDLGISEFDCYHMRCYTAILRDISELKQVTEELRIAKESAEAANRAKSIFLANMSHEIRTPLGAVMGFSELLTDPSISQSDKMNCVAAIKRNGELLSNIINDILDLSKIEAGRMKTEVREVALEEVLTDISNLMSLRARDKGLSYNITYDQSVPKIIKTDPIRLRQILINIVGNAIKFTENGSIEIALRLTNFENGEPKLAFIVKDTGPGIAQEQIGKLFQPFSQADNAGMSKVGGTGLGLVLSRNLAILLGGDVTLTETTVGRGSVFTVTIDPGPVSALMQQAEGEAAIQFSSSTERIRLDGVKVLLAEDSMDNQILIAKFLKLAGAEIETAENGKIALEKARNQSFDVILMDLQMPLMDGYEATAEMRKQGINTPIIALTAHSQKEERDRCLGSGFNDHLSKPVNRNILLQTIAMLSSSTHH